MAIELDNSFTVPVPPTQAWDVLLDVERIAPCMPGATVDEVNGDEIAGRVKVKLGPVSLTYKGTAKFTERDETGHTIAMEANGKETRGAGTASAVVNASLKPAEDDGHTLVSMHTTLNVTGRPAQFGRGVMADVSAKLVEQFATNLAQLISAGGSAANGAAPNGAAGNGAAGTATAGTGTAGAAGTGTAAAEPGGTARETGASAQASGDLAATSPAAPAGQDSINIVRLVSGPILKRLVPVAAVGAAIAYVFRRVRRRR